MPHTHDSIEKVDSAETAVTKSLEAANKLEELGAFIHLDADGAVLKARSADDKSAVGEAGGPLHGVPIVVKDNIHVADMPNSAGTLALENFIPKKSNKVVLALEAAGAIVVGKTNMHELAFGITSNNAAFGPVRNAHDPSLIAGGSSGGTAVAIAANIVTMGLGTDTGGSTRIPATLNGIVGFRPTLGRYDTNDVTPIASTRDTVGPLANSVASLALMDSVITNTPIAIEAAELKGLRLGVPREYFYADLSAEVRSNVDSVLTQLAEVGVVLVNVELPNLEALNNNVSNPVALHEFITQLPQYLKKHNTGVDINEIAANIKSPDVAGAVAFQQSPDAIPLDVYEQAINVYRPKLKGLYSDAFASYHVDAFIVPATPCAAQAIATSDETVELNGKQVPTFPTYIRNTDPTSNAGLPSLAMPSGKTSDGRPIGILLDGPEHSDRRLLEIALSIESLLSL